MLFPLSKFEKRLSIMVSAFLLTMLACALFGLYSQKPYAGSFLKLSNGGLLFVFTILALSTMANFIATVYGQRKRWRQFWMGVVFFIATIGIFQIINILTKI